MVTAQAWPKHTLYKCQVLLEAIDGLQAKNEDQKEGQQDSHYEAVCTRILEDEKFIRIIGK